MDLLSAGEAAVSGKEELPEGAWQAALGAVRGGGDAVAPGLVILALGVADGRVPPGAWRDGPCLRARGLTRHAADVVEGALVAVSGVVRGSPRASVAVAVSWPPFAPAPVLTPARRQRCFSARCTPTR